MEPDPVFQKALENFKEDLTVQQRREFGIITLQDVKNEVNKIQIQHGSAKKLRGMARMSKFLEAMQQLEQVISVFLNVSEAVAFIWGPIKFFLVVASSRLEILECLLDAFTDISEAMPDLQGYVTIFKDQPEVLEVLRRCYGDIIHFYHMAFGVLGRPGAFGIRDWRRIFDSVWKTFRTKFSPVLGSLRRHRELLVQVKLTATYGAVETTRHALQETIEKSNEELKQVLNVMQQQKKQTLDKLGSQGPHNDKGHRRLPDQRYPTSGDWILEEKLFLKWLDPNNLSNDLLYLNGMPGAGKTTLVSRIIDDMKKETTTLQRPLLNFYFELGQSGKTLMMDMLRSFIEQLLQQDDSIVNDLHETVLRACPSDLSSATWLTDVATRLLWAQKRCYIVVDGLDECALEQRKHVLQWLKTILSESKVSNVVIKVLVSGQRDGVIDAELQDYASSIKLDNQTPHLRDIENFASSVLSQIRDRFPDLDDEEEILRRLNPSRITEASKGMFMYAKVVLDNFLSQTSVYELEQELEREYPHGLDEAYDRVAERVLEKTSESRKRAALQILGLIACAARPLKWREIQCYFCIDATSGSCDPRRRKVGGPKDLCSSFVESEACTSFPNVPSEVQVMMVHNTAKSFLLRSKRLDMAQQHMQMSLFCFQYLTRSAFDMVNQDSKIADSISLTGFYGFFDYAVAHWDYHSLQYVQASPRKTIQLTEDGLGEPLSTAWMDFAKRFCDRQVSAPETSFEHDLPSDTSVPQPVTPDTVNNDGESCNIQDIFKDWTSTQQSTEFERLAKSLHQIMQHTDPNTLKDREKTVYLSLNGPFRPKCSRRGCVHFNTGFESEAELSLHTSWHEMAYKCPHTGCYAWGAGFRTNALLQIHLKRFHPATDSEASLFPVKSRNRPRKLIEACRLGDISLVRTFAIPTSTKANILAANAALHTAAQHGHAAICEHLTQEGANPYATKIYDYINGGAVAAISVIQMSIRLGDLDLFSALRNTVHEKHERAFIEETSALSECILDALESPISQFLVDMLAFSSRRRNPLKFGKILHQTGVEKRCVLSGHQNVRRGLRTLVSSELEWRGKSGLSPELCYEQVLVDPDSSGLSILHRLCGGGPEHTSYEAVRFLLAQLRPDDIRRYDFEGNPPLFTALRNKDRCEGKAFDDQANIIRRFFENDLQGAKSTRNTAGQGPLEFAIRHAPYKVLSLVFELCGASYSIPHLDDILDFQTECASHKTRMVFALDCADERIHMAVELDRGQIYRFASWLTDLESTWWLTDLKREQAVLNMLRSLILDPTPEHTTADTVSGVPESGNTLDSDNTKAAKIIFRLHEAEALPKRCCPELEDLARMQLRTLLTDLLRVRMNRFDIAEILSNQHKLGLKSTTPGQDYFRFHKLAARNREPNIISLLSQDAVYTDFSSRKTQDQLVQVLGDSLAILKNSGNQCPDGLIEYIETLIRFADAEGYGDFAISLNFLRQEFQ